MGWGGLERYPRGAKRIHESKKGWGFGPRKTGTKINTSGVH